MEPLIGMSRPASGGGSEFVTDGSINTFQRDVLEMSMDVPVLVDFWAPWCGPCKQLGPMLERLVAEARGAIRMVKINVDENQMLAQQLRIQTVPTVFVFKGGRPVDGFQGALPESQLRQFLAGHMGDAPGASLDQLLDAAGQAIAAGALDDAVAILAEVLQQEPENARAIGQLALLYVRLGQLEEAKGLLDSAPQGSENQPDIAAARAALALAEETSGIGDPAEYRGALDSDQNDHQARFNLALALTKVGEFDAAAEELVEIVRRDRSWNDDAARKQLVKMFEAFGQSSPFTLSARRKLSAVLFA